MSGFPYPSLSLSLPIFLVSFMDKESKDNKKESDG
jgi:hypothetical protein